MVQELFCFLQCMICFCFYKLLNSWQLVSPVTQEVQTCRDLKNHAQRQVRSPRDFSTHPLVSLRSFILIRKFSIDCIPARENDLLIPVNQRLKEASYCAQAFISLKSPASSP